RHHAQPCPRRVKHQVKHHFDLPDKDLLQHPLAGCRRLHRHYERKAVHFLAFTSIACTLT
ncbi:hypothetical protein ACWEQE_49065, partial [Streptomyces sp. NPDC004270]